jgi:hypothetical protein
MWFLLIDKHHGGAIWFAHSQLQLALRLKIQNVWCWVAANVKLSHVRNWLVMKNLRCFSSLNVRVDQIGLLFNVYPNSLTFKNQSTQNWSSNQACYKLVILWFRKRKEKFLFSFPKEQFWCLLFLSYFALYYFSSNIVTTIANNSLLAWYVN